MSDSRSSWLVGLGIGLLVLCFAGTAQAATRMYSGSLIIQSFGNDTTTGTAEPYTSGYAVGIPLTGMCNTEPLHLLETLTFSLPQDTPTYTVMFTIPTYGGQVPTQDTNGDTIPDIVPGCGDTTVQSGQPLSGAGPVNTTGTTTTSRSSLDPRGFTLPRWALRRQASGASLIPVS